MENYVLHRALAGELGLTAQEWDRAFETRLRLWEDWQLSDVKGHWRVDGLKAQRDKRVRPGLKVAANGFSKALEDLPTPHAEYLPGGLKEELRREWAKARTLQTKREVFSKLGTSREDALRAAGLAVRVKPAGGFEVEMTLNEKRFWLLESKQYDSLPAAQAAKELGLEAPEVTRLRTEAKLRPKPTKPASVSCAECGQDFIPKRSTARYCGGTCRLRAHRAKAA